MEDYKELVEFLDGKFNKIEKDISDFKNDMTLFKDQALKDLGDIKQESAEIDTLRIF